MPYFENVTDPFYQTLALLGLFILLFGLVSLFVKERLYLTESLVAILFGILFGPVCIPLINPKAWFSEEIFYRMVMEFSRVIISLQVMAVGLCTPFEYIRKEWKSISMLLGPTMIIMWVISALSVYLIMGFPWWESMMIGACLAPTDPVLANAVIKGKFANRYIPGHLRNLLSVESGANDGLGFPFLMLPVYMTIYDGHVGEAMKEWVIHTWLYEIFFSIVIGFLLGWVAKKLLEKSEAYRLIDKESFLVYAIALALTITGLVALISSDDLLSVFIAGNVFAYDDKFHQATKDAHFQEVLDILFNISFFIFLGSIFPWTEYARMGIGTLILTSAAILLLRRLPFIMASRSMIPQLRSNKEAFFAGWFGPMGVGAIFFAMVCHHNAHLSFETKSNVFTVVSFVVLSSIVIHGITVPITHISLKTKLKRKIRRQLKNSLTTTAAGGPTAVTLQEEQEMYKNQKTDILPVGIDRDHPVPDLFSADSPRSITYQSDSELNDGYITESKLQQETSAVSAVAALLESGRLDLEDPYAETIDLRGLTPEQVLKKLYPSGLPPTLVPGSTGNQQPPGEDPPSFGRYDSYDSTMS